MCSQKICAIVIFLGVVLTATTAFADAQLELRESSAIERAVRSGTLRVGMANFPPWSMKSKAGDWIGFEVDVAKKLAADMGVKLEVVPTRWENLIPDLLTAKFELIIAGMVSTHQRALKINFTTPYNYAGLNMVANRSTAAGLKEVNEFNRPDVILLCRSGTPAVEAVTKHLPKARLRLFSDKGTMIQALLNGQAHAAVDSAPEPAHLAIKYPETLYFVDGAIGKEPIAMGVRKGDPDSLAFLNNWIMLIQDTGFVEAKSDYWFETMDWRTLME